MFKVTILLLCSCVFHAVGIAQLSGSADATVETGDSALTRVNAALRGLNLVNSIVRVTAVRDASAINVMSQAIAAMGGTEAFQRLRDTVMLATSGLEEGTNAEQIRWTNDFTRSFPEFRKECTRAGHTTTMVSGHGRPAVHDGIRSRSLPGHIVLANPPLNVPGIVLAGELAERKYSIELVGTETVNERPAVHVRAVIAESVGAIATTRLDWYFDPVTHLPVKVEYPMPSLRNALHGRLSSLSFSDYRPQSGILLPFTLTHQSPFESRKVITVNSYIINSGVAHSSFELTGDK